MLSTLTKDRRETHLNWLEEKYGSVGESGGGDQELRHEFWFPGYVENKRKNNNLIKEGALKTLSYESFSSVVNTTVQELLSEVSHDPLVHGNILRRHWSQLSSATG